VHILIRFARDFVARSALKGLVHPRATRIGSGVNDKRHSFLLETIEGKSGKDSSGGGPKANLRVSRIALPNLKRWAKFMIRFAVLAMRPAGQITIDLVTWTKFKAFTTRSAFLRCELRPNPFRLDVNQRDAAFLQA